MGEKRTTPTPRSELKTAYIDEMAIRWQDTRTQDALDILIATMKQAVLAEIKRLRLWRPHVIEEAIQDGHLGLLQAARKWDRTRFSFASYATTAIHNEIIRGIQMRHRVGQHAMALRQKIHKAGDAFQKQHGRMPTDEEMATAVGVPVTSIVQVMPWLRMPKTTGPFRYWQQYWDGLQQADEKTPDPAESTEMSDVADAIAILETRQAQVLRMRYLYGMTLQAVGDHFNISKERVRQIEVRGLQNMRKLLGEQPER